MLRRIVIPILVAAFLFPACRQASDSASTGSQIQEINELIKSARDTARLSFLADSLAHRNNPAGESAVLMQYGKVLRESSRFYDAIEIHRRGYDCAALVGDTVGMVQHLNNIGTNFRRLGILEDASAYHYQALTLCEQYSDTESRTARKNRVISLNGIGNVQLTLGNSEAAEKAFRSALEGEALLGSALEQAINYANLGSILESRGQKDSARIYYQKSLEYNIEAHSDLRISRHNLRPRISILQGA